MSVRGGGHCGVEKYVVNVLLDPRPVGDDDEAVKISV